MSTDLDGEIEALEAKAASLRRTLAIEAATLISTPAFAQSFSSAPLSSLSSPIALPKPDPLKERLRVRATRQAAHNQQSVYRACTPITAFKVHDPDPNAVDDGAVLALRFESMRAGRFQAPHYVFLNRPWKPRSEALRVHRHTIPEWISLGAVATKYLPAPSLRDTADAGEGIAQEGETPQAGREQDLLAFARHIRRELTRRQLREGAISGMRDAAGLRRSRRSTQLGTPDDEGALSEITIVDAEAKHVKLEWADGRTGRLVLGDNAEVESLVAFQGDERDRVAERELIRDGHGTTLDQVTKWIAAG